MKEFLFNVIDLMDDPVAYKIKANNIDEAKELFKSRCIPLFNNNFNWDDFVTMCNNCDITINVIEVNNIIEL